MARWKLVCAHYINTVAGTEWEYHETDRTTGRQMRSRYKVPRLLDPNDPGDWTWKEGNKDNQIGEIIVCHEGKGERTDIAFLGDPTPDMIPMDDEAKAISATFTERWRYKPDTDAGNFSQSMIDRFQADMAEIKARPAEIPGMADLVSAIGKMAETNQTILQALAAQPKRLL
jgi:hypothetical protein